MPITRHKQNFPLFVALGQAATKPGEQAMAEFASLRPLPLGVDGLSAFQAVAIDMEILLSNWQGIRGDDVRLPGIRIAEIDNVEAAYSIIGMIFNRIIGETSAHQDARVTINGGKNGLTARLTADTLIAAAYSEAWDAIQSKDTWAPCKTCGEAFRRRSRKGQFCSSACQVADSRARQPV